MNKYRVSSIWAGRYAKTKVGYRNTLTGVVYIIVVWSVIEFFRVLRLNNYHYGNIFRVGKKLTDCYGELI